MAAPSFGDDDFGGFGNRAAGAPPTVKPRPKRPVPSLAWAQGLDDDVPGLAGIHPTLQKFTLRQLCPFGLDWSLKPVPVATEDMELCLASIQQELESLRKQVFDARLVNPQVDVVTRTYVRSRLITLSVAQNLLLQGLPHMQNLLSAWLPGSGRAATGDSPEAAEIEVKRFDKEVGRLQRRVEYAMRQDVREFYASLAESLDEDRVTNEWLKHKPTPAFFTPPPSKPAHGHDHRRTNTDPTPKTLDLSSSFFTDDFGTAEVKAILSARRPELDADTQRAIVREEVRRYRQRLRRYADGDGVGVGLGTDLDLSGSKLDESSSSGKDSELEEPPVSEGKEEPPPRVPKLVIPGVDSPGGRPLTPLSASSGSGTESDGDSALVEHVESAQPTARDIEELRFILRTPRDAWGGFAPSEAPVAAAVANCRPVAAPLPPSSNKAPSSPPPSTPSPPPPSTPPPSAPRAGAPGLVTPPTLVRPKVALSSPEARPLVREAALEAVMAAVAQCVDVVAQRGGRSPQNRSRSPLVPAPDLHANCVTGVRGFGLLSQLQNQLSFNMADVVASDVPSTIKEGVPWGGGSPHTPPSHHARSFTQPSPDSPADATPSTLGGTPPLRQSDSPTRARRLPLSIRKHRRRRRLSGTARSNLSQQLRATDSPGLPSPVASPVHPEGDILTLDTSLAGIDDAFARDHSASPSVRSRSGTGASDSDLGWSSAVDSPVAATRNRSQPSASSRPGSRLGSRLLTAGGTRITFREVLGKGAAGTVYLAEVATADPSVPIECVAVKQFTVSKGDSSAGLKQMLRLEASMLARLSHPNVVQYRGLHYSRRRREYNMLLEYASGGSLEGALRLLPAGFPEPRLAELTAQLLHGVAYLHSKRIIHRDLKPANLLLSADGDLKITDFDTATHIVGLNTNKRTCVGTPHYTAPEIIQVEAYSVSADIWSVGCCVLELATGQRPFASCNGVQALFRMVEEEHPPLPDGLSFALQDFLLQCWVRDAAMRPSAASLLSHPFLVKHGATPFVPPPPTPRLPIS